MQGLFVRSFRGTEGKIIVPGLGAVVATFRSWHLQRREESGSDGPSWSLHAVCSYVNPTLLNNGALPKRYQVVINKDTVDLCDPITLTVEGSQLIAEGVKPCQD